MQHYKEKYGTHVIPRDNPQYKGLLDWFQRERFNLSIDIDEDDLDMSYPRSRRIKFFESIGILAFSEPDDEDRHWDEHFKAFVKFRSDHGHCLVPKSYRALYDWLEVQRNDYEIFVKSENKDSKMTVQRYFRLEAIGLIWVPKVIDMRKNWTSQYKSLKRFRKVNNHCSVSWADPRHRELGFWVTAQRVIHRVKSEGVYPHIEFFNNRHEELLNNIGFQWTESTNPYLNCTISYAE